ncbi:hypothetical protein Q7P37_009995 [Cladosporium fusiforme]
MTQRIDGFPGSEAEYRTYLESLVLTLRGSRHSSAQTSRVDNGTTHSEQVSSAPNQPNNSSVVSTRKRVNTDGLEVRLWQPKPLRDHSGSRTFVRAPKRRPQWQINADNLIDGTPKALRDFLEQQGVLTIMRNGEAAAHLLNVNDEEPQCRTQHSPPASTLCLENASITLASIQRYAEISARYSQKASLASMIANFQKLLVLSACAVVLRTDESLRESILEIVCILQGSTDKQYARRLVRTAVYVNRLIDMLSVNGWDDQAAVLVLLWNRPPTYYYLLASSRAASLEYIKRALSAKDFDIQESDWPRKNSLFVPSLVDQVLGGTKHIATITHELGYRNAHLFETSLSLVNPSRIA